MQADPQKSPLRWYHFRREVLIGILLGLGPYGWLILIIWFHRRVAKTSWAIICRLGAIRIHTETLIVAVLMAGALAFAGFRTRPDLPTMGTNDLRQARNRSDALLFFSVGYARGWPFVYDACSVSYLPPKDLDEETLRAFRQWPDFGPGSQLDTMNEGILVVDAAIALIIVVCTAGVVELRRRRFGPIRYSVRSLLAFTALVAVFFALLRIGVVTWKHVPYAVAWFGVGCVAVILGRAAILAVLAIRSRQSAQRCPESG